MKKLFVFIAVIVSSVTFANNKNWGPTGHRATGEIAQKYLNICAKRSIRKLLQGQSLAFVSTYADEIKSDKRFNKYYTWHYINMPLEQSYKESEKNPKGDLVTGIRHCLSVLKDKKSSVEDKRFFLKLLVHFMGDLHQPLHIGLKHDHGGNKVKVDWHFEKSNLHRVWDDDLIAKWNMSYKEFAENEKVLTKKEVKAIEKGTLVDWVEDTHKLTREVYADAKGKNKLSYKYSYKWMPAVREQFQKGGIRLAKLLNEVF